MRLRRWERWMIIETEAEEPHIKIVGRHFTRWGACLARDFSFSSNTLAAMAYWNTVWPDNRITSWRQEITRSS